ncbi:AraC family transcriptional regulator [Clostridium sp. SHJSY1]|uniref:AraC family transcriptional regulator n=1 Tax=Clostridium sp. SHJSY1 TaxID=2942483 RepID=UPI002876DE3E|nr:AraC family transcriptional regulator [Clostridium sp. SHJSY1]MDS0527052.1 AraC family transcriptional regulator [Clostridium sp. SHJSY1]
MEENTDIVQFLTGNQEGVDLIVYQGGMEKCKESHSYGPAVRDHFLIHYILEGSGTFYVDGKSYKLHKNQGFLICPDVITYYEANDKTPWTYTWIGFRGIKAENYLEFAGLDRYNPIFEYKQSNFVEKCFENMREAAKLKYGRELRLQGLLSIFLSELIEKAEKNVELGSSYKDIYIKKTLQYIDRNFARKIKISEIAESIGLNKNYFSSFFRENFGISPQEYLIKYRINKACELMKNEALTISDISRSVGYNDPLAFSKIFKKVKGKSPKKYRQDK